MTNGWAHLCAVQLWLPASIHPQETALWGLQVSLRATHKREPAVISLPLLFVYLGNCCWGWIVDFNHLEGSWPYRIKKSRGLPGCSALPAAPRHVRPPRAQLFTCYNLQPPHPESSIAQRWEAMQQTRLMPKSSKVLPLLMGTLPA